MKKKNPIQHSDSMFMGAPASSFLKAKYLREQATEEENILWEQLRNKKFLGLKFRRQHLILVYIADFYCHPLSLIIELDGEYHQRKEQKEKDKERTNRLEEAGITVIRFTNNQVINNLESVLSELEILINEQHLLKPKS